MRWLGNLTDRQYWWLAGITFVVVVIGAGTGTTQLLNHFGWRAIPVLLFVVAMAAGGVVLLLRMLRRTP